MEEIKKKRKLREKLKDRYRLVIFNEDTIENVWQGVLSRMNFIVWIGLVGVLLVAIGIVLVSFTPLREYIPGYPDGNIRRTFILNSLKADSLAHRIALQDQYIENVRSILRGNETKKLIDTTTEIKTKLVNLDSTNFDSAFVLEYEQEEKYGVSNIFQLSEKEDFNLNKLHFFCPVKGAITNEFDASKNHFGIDLASNLNEPVLSVLPGTIVLVGWTIETGYVIQVQHKNNLISIYKHNSQLLKKTGDKVNAGEPIAIIGNTGEYSTGPHLHFEIWYNGNPLNPKNYIVF